MAHDTIQDREPNFRGGDGQLYLVRCFSQACNNRENWAMVVAKGRCAWCGWKEDER
jgi:hypothetical protein